MRQDEEWLEPTAAETAAYQLRLMRRLLRDMLTGVREGRSAENLPTDRDTMFRVLPDSFRVGQMEAWIETMKTAADILDADDFYGCAPALEKAA